MIWLLVGLMIGSPLGMLLMAMVSINRHRDMQAVADAAVVYVNWQSATNQSRLIEAVDRLMAE